MSWIAWEVRVFLVPPQLRLGKLMRSEWVCEAMPEKGFSE